jgi:single-strand DNA-binding protein
MGNGLNKAQFIGFLGRNPEVHYTSDGTPVANVSLAVTESWKDKASGERKQKTEWLRLVAWNKLAEIIGEHAKAGHLVYVEAKVRTRKYTDKDNIERWITEFNVQEFNILNWTTSAQRKENTISITQQSSYDIIPSVDDDIPF